MFESNKEQLSKLLERIHEGEIQLPDFQRGWVWPDSSIRSLLASIASGFPVGALLTLQTGGDVNFQPRLIEGVPAKDVKPDELLLDGQQRMTTLYRSLYSKDPVETRNDQKVAVERYYYLDIETALKGENITEEAIVAVPQSRIEMAPLGREEKRNLSTREHEFSQHMFPLNQVFDATDWYHDWRDYWEKATEGDQAKANAFRALEKSFDRDLLPRFTSYEVPYIRLNRKTSRKAVCVIFEKVNTGGKKLDAFELLTAIYAAENFDLRKDWLGEGRDAKGRESRLHAIGNAQGVLKNIANTDFLQACTLLHAMERRDLAQQAGKEGRDLPFVTCRHEDILDLPLSAYRKFCDPVEKGFVEASKFLSELKVMWYKDVPYPPQLVALASIYASIGKEALTAPAAEKLEHWYWSVALGEYYGSTTEGKIARDVPELIAWIRGGTDRPRTLDETLFQADRLNTLRSRGSAAYKAVHALLMKRGARDFISGKTTELMSYYKEDIDIHHIFPKKWCQANGITPRVFNSIINKAPLSAGSNREIGGRPPSEYLDRIQAKHNLTNKQLDEILVSHLIDPELLRKDDFESFFASRKRALAQLVGEAMRRPISMEPLSDVPDVNGDDDLDDDDTPESSEELEDVA